MSSRNLIKKDESGISGKFKSEEQKEMECLLESLPTLNECFQLHSKIGQGTFSTVYLATQRNSTSTQKYAVKHLTQACEKSRIENELRCLQEIGGKDNVVSAEFCLANGKNCVTFIMPYLAHCRFSDYLCDMDAEETRFYMKNLFIALKRVHSFNIIHRDVKPNNFLYNREKKQFLLVDFGLAQLVRKPNQETCNVTVVDENKPIDYSKKRKKLQETSDDENNSPAKKNKRIALKIKDDNRKISTESENIVHETRTLIGMTLNKSKKDLSSSLKQWMGKSEIDEALIKPRIFNSKNVPSSSRRKFLEFGEAMGSPKSPNSAKNIFKSKKIEHLTHPNEASLSRLVPAKSSKGNFLQIQHSNAIRQKTTSSTSKSSASQRGASNSVFSQSCLCSGRGAICSTCSSRQPMFAPRAGTSGFRPPEVLFKYLHQTTAVDMWASGVVMLCILSGCYPFFNSFTDLGSLAEIMTIFGTERTISVAQKFGRRILCSEYRREIDLKKLCKRLRARSARKSKSEKSNSNEPKCRDCFQAIKEDGCLCLSDETRSPSQGEASFSNDSSCHFPDSAYDLLYRLLDLDPTTRITAAEALEHPFITGQL